MFLIIVPLHIVDIIVNIINNVKNVLYMVLILNYILLS